MAEAEEVNKDREKALEVVSDLFKRAIVQSPEDAFAVFTKTTAYIQQASAEQLNGFSVCYLLFEYLTLQETSHRNKTNDIQS